MTNNSKLEKLSDLLRRDVIEMTTEAGSGHPTSCMSCAEVFSVLFFDEMNYDPEDASNPGNDEFVLSKGHSAPIWYASLDRAGAIDENLDSLRKLDSHLQGHPMPISSGMGGGSYRVSWTGPLNSDRKSPCSKETG
ncbi:MAG: transketolase subunit [Candidatus Nanosalina sp. J07AB43]|nr:MAG: transketolase subunit [Candidatus Nanosalina sp. J07AB43]